MDDIRFEWDPAKARLNARKHGVTFEEALTAFLDENALIVDDPEHSGDESRFVPLGFSVSLRMLVVVHVYQLDPETIRIVSARKATRSERAAYVARHQR